MCESVGNEAALPAGTLAQSPGHGALLSSEPGEEGGRPGLHQLSSLPTEAS